MLPGRAVRLRDGVDNADPGASHGAARRAQAVRELLGRNVVAGPEQGEPAGGFGQAVELQETSSR